MIEHRRKKPGLSYFAEDVEYTEEDMDKFIRPFADLFWRVNLIDAQKLILTYSDLNEIAGVEYDALSLVMTTKAEIEERGKRE